MKEVADSRVALTVITIHLLQAAIRGDTDSMNGHMMVYQSMLKAAGRYGQECVSVCEASSKII